MTGWIDVSLPLFSGMVNWPGDPAVRVELLSSLAHGDDADVSAISMAAHTGTHVDAPAHYLRGGSTTDAMPIAAMIGPARVIQVACPGLIAPGDLASRQIQRGERILFKTLNSERRIWQGSFQTSYTCLSPETAQYLADLRISMVGIDALSIGAFDPTGAEAHRALLSAGVWIVEGLDLSAAPEGPCEFLCLPLRLARADGAPARALLRPL